MKTMTLTCTLEVEDAAVEELKKVTHHAEYLFDLDTYPEITSVSNITIKEEN